jgi:hypothetical protein
MGSGLRENGRHCKQSGKHCNQQALQRGIYGEIRATYQLPAQMACNVPRQVRATYNALWTKVKHNAAYSKWAFADLVGARNITMRTLLVRQDWARTRV